MNLTTTFLGLELRTPLMPSAAGPLSEDLDHLKRLEDAGASAVVLHSLFEEQIEAQRQQLFGDLERGMDSYAEALTYFPAPTRFRIGPELYLEHIRAAKRALGVPVIASLNASTNNVWVDYAGQIQQAGADALELNVYWIPTDPGLDAAAVEQVYVDILRAVKARVTIPVAVKLSPFFSSLAHLVLRLEAAGADGFTLFNRFYQPDLDLERLEVTPNVLLSTPMAMRLPLRWIAILRGGVKASLAASSGIHRATDAIKMLMVGADVTMMCSALLRHGPRHLGVVEQEMVRWLEEHEYDSVRQLKGSMSQQKCPTPAAFERAQYVMAVANAKYA